ncbi:unnamed protein product [Cylicocyclus nassatus]|uniref:RNA helicase n=1 Tax=Cylicocyclus nassatus TaxID=53992 RepID=A0AA36DQB9_CYLNA|nr:unnamed protein product [Cylicocyclus nassatus]
MQIQSISLIVRTGHHRGARAARSFVVQEFYNTSFFCDAYTKEKLMKSDKRGEHVLLAVPAEDKPQKKLTLTQKIVAECKHYYHGFRLLALETRLSAKYMWRVLRGDTLSRRERQQLVRTVSDLFRIVPFSIFIIVPFMELALPIFIKLFPNMLPSTFQESSKQEEKLRKQVQVKVEMAKFLQDTIEEIALERRSKAIEPKGSKAVEFAQFIKKVRSEGGYVSNKDLLKFTKLFEDELTLDNLSMSQLRSLCRVMSIQPFGSPEILRFQLHMKLRELKADDKQIAAEGGVEALNTLDLQQACRARGMRAIGLSEQRLREQLGQWLELSLNDKIPPSLLLLSRALYLPEDISFTDRLKALVQSLPEGIAESTRQKLTELEGGKVDHKARLDLIKQIEEAIAKEKAIEEEKKKEKEKVVLAEGEKERVAAEEIASMSEGIARTSTKIAEAAATVSEAIHAAKKELVDVVQEAVDAAKATEKEKAVAAEAPVDPKDLSSIEQILVGGPIDEAKNEILELKEKAIEHSEDLHEITALDSGFSETKVAKRLRTKLNTMIDKVDTLVSKLEEEKRAIKETLPDPAMASPAATKKNKNGVISTFLCILPTLKKYHHLDEEQWHLFRHLRKAYDHFEKGVAFVRVVLKTERLFQKMTPMTLSALSMVSVMQTRVSEQDVNSMIRTSTRAVLVDMQETTVLERGGGFGQQKAKESGRARYDSVFERSDLDSYDEGEKSSRDIEDKRGGFGFGRGRSSPERGRGGYDRKPEFSRGRDDRFGDSDGFRNRTGDRGFNDSRNDRGFGNSPNRGFGQDRRQGPGGGDRGPRGNRDDFSPNGDRGFGKRGRNNNGFGRDDGGFGRNNGGFGRRDGGFDRNDGGFGRNEGGFGRSDGGGFGRSDGGGFGRNEGGGRNGGGFGRGDFSGYGNRDGPSFGGGRNDRNQRGPREFVPGGPYNEDRRRAPRDWNPEENSVETLFERDALNAEYFDKDRDDPVTIEGDDEDCQIKNWENSGLNPRLIQTCVENCRYKYVRPIQAAVIPMVLRGKDVMGHAETGGGKTAAFVLPILHYIMGLDNGSRDNKGGKIVALVVAPTRELAKQLFDSFRKHAHQTDVKCCVAYGEIARFKNLTDIHKGCDVLVGTSGRLMDFIQKGDVNLSQMKFLVLDEADMLLRDGRDSHLEVILSDSKFPSIEKRQTLLFSATFPPDVTELARKVLKNSYVKVSNGARGRANARVKQEFVQATGICEKNAKLFGMLEEQRDKLAKDGTIMRTLVFVETKKQADFVALMLTDKNIKAASINGDRPQNERERVIKQFREGAVHVLVGTDVCQRGLDIPALEQVINYDMPNGTPEEARDKYIHRIGRTGRLYNGVAVTFVDTNNNDRSVMKLMVDVAKETGQEVPDWLENMAKTDSFSSAGFGPAKSEGNSGGFGSSGFGTSGFGASTSGFGGGGFGSGSGFGENAEGFGGTKMEKKDGESEKKEFGSGGFGEGVKKMENKENDDSEEKEKSGSPAPPAENPPDKEAPKEGEEEEDEW